MPEQLKKQIFDGYEVSYADAQKLAAKELAEICCAAEEIRKHFCLNDFDLCTVIKAKSSIFSQAHKDSRPANGCSGKCKMIYSLWDVIEILKKAQYNFAMGALRLAIVTEGKTLPKDDLPVLCQSYRSISKHSGINLCAAHGFLSQRQFGRLKESGVTRYHVNLRAAESFYLRKSAKQCYDLKVKTIKNAQKAGLHVCAGVMMGAGEYFLERLELAVKLRDLGIKTLLVGIGRIAEKELLKAIAIFRFLLPDATIRLDTTALQRDNRRFFTCGANAALADDAIEKDIDRFEKMGFRINTR